MRDPERCRVAAVFDNIVKIYGPSHDGFRQDLKDTRVFSNNGQAKEFAADYDYSQRKEKGE